MNTKISFIYRTLLVSVFVIALLAAVPAGASYYQSPDGLTLPAGWAAIHMPFLGIKDIVVTPPVTPTTTEGGGSVTISVVLNDPQPTADVTISVSSTNTSEGAVSTNQLVFTSVNYTTPQDITVTGQPDDIDDGDIAYQIQFVVTSTDTEYDGYALGNIDLTNTDDDTAGVTVTPISGLVSTEALGMLNQLSLSSLPPSPLRMSPSASAATIYQKAPSIRLCSPSLQPTGTALRL